MTRLQNAGLVATLERRIGGIRAGSAGHVYALTAAGRKFLALLKGQKNPPRIRYSTNPGALFLAHALAIAEIYVSLHEASNAGQFQLTRFHTEPASWWPTKTGETLKPDSYVVARGAQFADCWWLEVDQGTENPGRLSAKCAAYLEFLNGGGLGPDRVPPRVLFTAPDAERLAVIRRAISKASTGDSGLIVASLHENAVGFISEELHKI